MTDLALLVNYFAVGGAILLALVSLWVARSQAGGDSKVLQLLQRHEEERWQEVHQRLRHFEARFALPQNLPDFSRSEAALPGLKGRLQILELRMGEHDALLCSLVTENEARHLWNLRTTKSVKYERHPGLDEELRSLVRRGLVVKQSDFKIHQLPASFTPKELFALTDTGETLLLLRRHLQAKDIRPQDSLPPPPLEAAAHESDSQVDASDLELDLEGEASSPPLPQLIN